MRALRLLGHAALVLGLTLLTQIGGLAWLLACLARRGGRRLAAFALAYAALSAAAVVAAPAFGRVPLDCRPSGPLQVHGPLYCVLHRHYVAPELADALRRVAAKVAARHPGTVTRVLDASFPFLNGFPMLPHLSHDDGEKADLAFLYADASAPVRATPSPIGYFAFEPGPTDCPPARLTLRWDLAPLQPLWRDLALDEARTATLLEALAADPAVGKILLEPHLTDRLGAAHPKIRFQGCRAARHDDHIHLQLGRTDAPPPGEALA